MNYFKKYSVKLLKCTAIPKACSLPLQVIYFENYSRRQLHRIYTIGSLSHLSTVLNEFPSHLILQLICLVVWMLTTKLCPSSKSRILTNRGKGKRLALLTKL